MSPFVKFNTTFKSRQNSVLLIAVLLIVLVISACTTSDGDSAVTSTSAPGLTLEPTATSSPKPTEVPPTATKLPALPSPTPAPTATTQPTPTKVPTVIPSNTPTPQPPTPTPLPTSTPLPPLVVGELPDGVSPAFTVSESLERNPTPTATSFPDPSQPFAEASPTPTSGADLQPYFGNGQPVRVRNPHGGPFTKKSDLLVDFYVTNAGTETVTGDYFIDLYIDNEIAQRWRGIDISPNRYIFVNGGTGLLDLFNLQPGEHEVKLVIDPTNKISEKSDGDNTYTQPFTWNVEPAPTASPEDVLPNLSLLGDSTGIRIAPFLGAAQSGGLSTKGPTTVEFSALNDSPVGTDQDFSLNVWFDDMLVYFNHYAGARGGGYAYLSFEDLASVVNITPGEHTIRLVADPGNVIEESDETDNEIELTLTWGTDDPITAPSQPFVGGAPIRDSQQLPNLSATTPFGWDAALTASNAGFEYEPGQSSPVWASADTSVGFSVRNSSRATTPESSSFEIQLVVDREIIETITLESGDDAGAVWSESFTLPANSVTPGHHFVQIIVDSEDIVPEFDETDNSIGRWFEFLSGEPVQPQPEPVEFSDADIRAAFTPLSDPTFVNQVRRADGSSLDLPNWYDEIEEMGRYGYYLLTGRDLEKEPVVIHILPHGQFIAASYNACMTDYYLWTLNDYIDIYNYCGDFRGEIGFKYRLDGKIHVFVDMQESPIEALGTYFHELGHAFQDLVNPDQTAIGIEDSELRATLRGLHEAQAQAFEAAALRSIEEYIGVDLMRFPNSDVMNSWVGRILEITQAQDGSAEHVLGHTLLWYESLADSSGLNLDDELRANGVLSATSAKSLFDFLVALKQEEVLEWRAQISANPALLDEYIEISLGRLEDDLPSQFHGNPGLVEPAFLIP